MQSVVTRLTYIYIYISEKNVCKAIDILTTRRQTAVSVVTQQEASCITLLFMCHSSTVERCHFLMKPNFGDLLLRRFVKKPNFGDLLIRRFVESPTSETCSLGGSSKSPTSETCSLGGSSKTPTSETCSLGGSSKSPTSEACSLGGKVKDKGCKVTTSTARCTTRTVGNGRGFCWQQHCDPELFKHVAEFHVLVPS